MKEASTQWTGTFPLIMSKGIVSLPLPTVIVTFDPAGPFIRRTMLS